MCRGNSEVFLIKLCNTLGLHFVFFQCHFCDELFIVLSYCSDPEDRLTPRPILARFV